MGDPMAWIGAAFALVVLANFGLADPIRYTLIAVILLVLLRNGRAIATATDRFIAALGGRSSDPRPGGPRAVPA